MAKVAEFMDEAISHHEDEAYLAQIAEQVKTFLSSFPLYPSLQ